MSAPGAAAVGAVGIAAIAGRMRQLEAMLPGSTRPAPATAAPTTGVDFAHALAGALGDTSGSPSLPGLSGLSGLSDLSGRSGVSGLSGLAGAGASSVDGADVTAAARRYLGVPYVWGGTDPATGLDCSGLVQRVYADNGITLPRVSRDQARAGQPVADLAAARPGDLVAFGRPVNHIGIYLGDNQMIHAPEPGASVRIQRVYETPTAIRRVLPDPVTAGAAVAGRSGAFALGAVGGTSGTSGGAYAGLFAAATQRYGLPQGLLSAVASAESGNNPAAVSRAGARGLMQLMPGTAAELGVDPFVPAQAVDGAARLLRGHLDRFGSVPLALAAYNAGPGAVSRHGGIPPYTETQNYVRRIMTALGAAGGQA